MMKTDLIYINVFLVIYQIPFWCKIFFIYITVYHSLTQNTCLDEVIQISIKNNA